jgi:O-antigen biosynthesis protein
MQLSIILVNYNVKLLLEVCLLSVQRALEGVEAEIWVVDNASTDQSLEYLVPKFPHVHFIANAHNVGFGKACNQALKLARGKYILFLNPDTIVPPQTLKECLRVMEKDPTIGALGVRIEDPHGHYLPESKRGFPSPWVSFCKLSGLTALFPHSKYFAGYYLGHLPADQSNQVDVLPGAFMMLPRQVLEKTGGFDERFFMYGEDIDLSHRVKLAGYHNYYFAQAKIVHYKGASTDKQSSEYLERFYGAMKLFAAKYYGDKSAYAKTLQAAIGLRQWLAGQDQKRKR